ncbi:AmiS/UreI family transporter [Pseudonocardia spinosispora]|uniref:AmiS/UreI family transporter n=1 Tax=Pseudonocardia spinosispora TaxID=103441 RepID=UPI00040DCD2A|nr:AmiS/UreI family transporter [Pseudonocardia spinosispora]
MNNVGLLYVGAVLLINGLMLLGYVPARSAGVFNLFVGALQCVTPVVLIIQAGDDHAAIFGASGLFLFGFTYLYVGIVNLAGLEPEGIGWFSLFVAAAALVYAGTSFGSDPVFGVIWLCWALLWTLFFLVLGLGKQQLTRFTGWAVVLLSQPTCTVPAFLAMTDSYRSTGGDALVAAVVAVVLIALAAVLSRKHTPVRHSTTVTA